MQHKDHRQDPSFQAKFPLCRYKRSKHGGIKDIEFPSVCCKPFKSQIDGTMWVDLPFQYEPFWEKKIVVSKS